MVEELTRRDARKLFLQQQGLLRGDNFGRGPAALARALQRLSYLQIDTISVVDRAHQHVARSRVSNFTQEHLDKIVSDRHAYEYWSHAAAFLPFEQYRYSLPVMKGWRESRSHNAKLTKQIISRIRTEGPLQSKDFEDSRKNKTSGWWDWKPAKQALEYLFMSGDLMVTARSGFQKVFDLPENVIPAHVDTSYPNQEEWADNIIERQITAQGVATEYDLSYARPTIWRLARINLKDDLRSSLERQVNDGRLVEVQVDGQLNYTTPEILDQLPLRVTRTTVKILSPFDNLVINRRRTQALFDFEYQLECYVPAAKRHYGYFVLPILWGDELIGRMDSKANRKTATFQVHNLFLEDRVLEDKVITDDRLIKALAAGIRQFALDHGCTTIEISRCEPNSLHPELTAELSGELLDGGATQ